ncbi:hypothetical protein CJJ07_002276 [Candidozyma auris]|nr:hypothetical protein CJJ07_002276 [[Candida] auris]QEL61036.1 hypothetical protein CJJ09_003172 [[Candida] auris]
MADIKTEDALAQTGHETQASNSNQSPQEVDETDYAKLYEDLQSRFNEVYAVSHKLAITERAQRQTLYHYRRKIDALLDYMAELKDYEEESLDTPLKLDTTKIENVIKRKPELSETLKPLLQMSNEDDPKDIKFKRSYNVNLTVDESIPEIQQDELDAVEVNPQETEMWVRRNYPHLVVSKFRPVEIRGKDVREFSDSQSSAPKKRRKNMIKE